MLKLFTKANAAGNLATANVHQHRPLHEGLRTIECEKCTPLLKTELEFLTDLMKGYYAMRWTHINFDQRHHYFGWSCLESPTGKRIGEDAYGQRDAAATIAEIAEKGMDCSGVLPELIGALKNGSFWPVKSHAAIAIRHMASFGTDCSSALPSLQACIEKNWEEEPVKKEARATLEAIEKSSENPSLKLRHLPEYMKARIMEIAERLEPIGLGAAMPVLIADGCTSTLYRFRQNGRFTLFGVPSSISEHERSIMSHLKEKTLAYSRDEKFHGLVVLLNPSALPNGPEFENTMLHELTHLSKKLRQCLSLLKKKWRSGMRDAEGRKYLSSIVDEGFAYLVSELLVNPNKLESVEDARTSAKGKLEALKREVAELHGWCRANAVESAMREYAHEIGNNFMLQAHAILQRENPADYLAALRAVPPTPVELLSLDGGTQWAERVRQKVEPTERSRPRH